MAMLLRLLLSWLLAAVIESLATDSTEGTFFFTEQPEDAELNEGDTKKLFCSVDRASTPGLTYTWYKSDTFEADESVDESRLVAIPGERASVLHFSSIQRTDTGYYHCMVSTDTYKLFSQTAYIRVKYFDFDQDLEIETIPKEISDNKDVEYLPCNTPESDPPTEITWTLNDVTIDDPRMFVFPEDYTSSGITRGTLMIINANRITDAGMYACYTTTEDGEVLLLSKYQVTTKTGSSTISVAPSLAYKSSVGGEVNVVLGGAITMVCAGIGYPTPQYEWTRNDEDIRSADSITIEDNGRRLVVSNVREKGTYKCIMSNVDDSGDVQERPQPFYVKLIEDVADFDIDILRVPSQYNILKPNQYSPFNLECSVRKTGQIQIMWLKDGNLLEYNPRITTNETESEIDFQTATNRILIFENPNENDLGVYQCIIYNSERLKVETTYVTLEVDRTRYEIESRKPEYTLLNERLTVDEAEERCMNEEDAHLVSIMSEEENTEVYKILMQNNLDQVWIGLTREKPEPVGSWLWTHPGDISTSYSNWETDKPDNRYGRQEYAVMMNGTGTWLDVSNDDRFPAICKRYVVVCPSVDDFYDGKVRVRGWESTGATYEVGETVDIYCRFRGSTELTQNYVTCDINGQFTPATLPACPEGGNSATTRSTLLALLVAVLSTL